MDIQSFKIFQDVAESRSFSRGAGRNAISQSAASQSIRQLERDLGLQLIDRKKRPLELTAAGRVYLKSCRDILHLYEETQAKLAEFRLEVSGTVRVASIYSIGLYDMARYTQEFSRRHPQASVQMEYLRTDKVYEAVLEDKVDLGLVSFPTHSKELKIIDWRREKMVAVCSPEDPLAKEQRIPPSALEGRQFVCFDYDLTIRKVIDRYLREQRVTVRPAMEFDNIETIKEAVAVGAGVSILPEPTLLQDLSLGRLRALPLEGPELLRTLGIIHHRRKKLTPAGARFLELLRTAS